ncbi:MAG: hypothetical protein Greene101449_90 [Candidatus Peregrinibacteria bacterium Greene1014_49]|nr:MAG: hypothetical protein Greene101449_90 [Candidatus Peregrinibacteria bacterium Greene1014_49]
MTRLGITLYMVGRQIAQRSERDSYKRKEEVLLSRPTGFERVGDDAHPAPHTDGIDRCPLQSVAAGAGTN